MKGLKLSHFPQIRNTREHAFWFNLGIIILIFIAAEVFSLILERRADNESRRIRTEGVYEVLPDDLVGAKLKKNSSRQARKYVDGKLLYEVTITNDSNGLRITPPCSSDCDTAILFFGDSFTYGEGVNDEETMPYLVGTDVADRYCVYNFAVHGYGTHQMLSLIEHGIVARTVRQKVKTVVYQALYPEHVHRLAGYYSWNAHGPQYEIGHGGKPVFMGRFDDTPENWLQRTLRLSSLGRRILDYHPSAREHDKDLFVSMVIRSYEILREKDTTLAFHMIVWDWVDGADQERFNQLEDAGIRIHYIRDILPDGDQTNLKYRISPDDKHPNAATQQLIADYILENVIAS